MKFLSRLIFTWVMLMFAENICAQQYFFTNYTNDDGLSNTSVSCIVKDDEGFLWAGTEGGLNRFNGYDFTVYKSLANDTTTLSSNAVHCLLADASGNMWAGTTNGICLFDKKNNRFIRINVRSRSGTLHTLYETFRLVEDSKKNIWAGVSGFGLIKYDKEQKCFVEAIEDIPPFSNNMVNGITEDLDGSLWLLSYKGLLNFNPETKIIKAFENKLSDNSKFQGLNIFQDDSDKNFLWIATWGNGVVHFNKLRGEFTSYKFRHNASPNLDNIVFNVHHYSKSKLWLATNRGVLVFDAEKKIFDGSITDSINAETVINGQVHTIYKDNEGVIWLGSAGGLCNIHPEKQNFINHPLWMNSPANQYYFDEAENKFYGARIYTNRVLIIYDRKLNKTTEYKIPKADELRAEPFAIVKDNNGLIWIGTTKGIYTFDETLKQFSLFGIEKQLHIPDRSVFIRHAIKDITGNLWFSCYSKGLLMVEANTKKITSWFHDDRDTGSFPFYAITGVATGTGKTIYACDEKLGALEFDYEKKETRLFSAKEKKYAALHDATDIAVDKNKQIWVTTKNNGLVRIDKNKEAVAFIRDNFGNIIDEQFSVAIDDSEKIWLTTSNGIYRFEPSLKSFTQFTVHDGLPVRTIVDALHPMSNGKIAFQFYKGIYCFDPMKVSKTSKPLYVHLTSLLVNGKSYEHNNVIDQLDTIRLTHTENTLTAEFAAIDFAYPSSVLYSYMLEGIDNRWSAPTTTRVLNFSQLPPGDFYLHIRAGDNSPEKKIFIQIIPAWWQTAWFKWLTAAALIIVLFFIIRFFLSIRYKQKIAQLERQHEIEAVRMRISRDIHDDIGSGLTKIKLMSRNLSKAKEEIVMHETTTRIAAASDELIQNLGEIVWTINPANDTLENVFGFMRNYVSKLFDENPDIKLKLDFTEPEKIPHISINPEVKRNLLLILKESLTNTFKHAQATEVTVTLLADRSKIELRISDNGKGMEKINPNDFGNGLKNMRRRAESINVEFNIDSNTETGTTVQLIIPLGLT